MDFLTFSETASKRTSKKKKKAGKKSKTALPGIFGRAPVSQPEDGDVESTETPRTVSTRRVRKADAVKMVSVSVRGASKDSDDESSEGSVDEQEDDIASEGSDASELSEDHSNDDDNNSDDSHEVVGDEAMAALGVDQSQFHKPRTTKSLSTKKSRKSRTLTSTGGADGFFGPSFASALWSILESHVGEGADPVLFLMPHIQENIAQERKEQRDKRVLRNEKRKQRRQFHVVLKERPEEVWTPREKHLRETATMGVSQLFGAIRKAQRSSKQQEGEKPEFNKEAFLDLLKAPAPAPGLTPFQRNTIALAKASSASTAPNPKESKRKQAKRAQEEAQKTANPQMWKALTDDLYNKGALKSWDD